MPWSSTRRKGSSTARGYGAQHRKLREALLPAAYGMPCYRCGELMLRGQELHFDHLDDRSGYGGFSHAKCNVKAGAQKGRRTQVVVKRRKRAQTMIDRW